MRGGGGGGGEEDIHAVTNFKGQILHCCLAILFCKVNKEKENN